MNYDEMNEEQLRQIALTLLMQLSPTDRAQILNDSSCRKQGGVNRPAQFI